MKNRLLEMTADAFKKNRKLFCAFVTLGFPNLKATEELILAFEQSGVDIVELGFPFSDPMADGPTIQYSSEIALQNGVKMSDAFQLMTRLRKKGCKLPVLFFSYLNPILSYGYSKFARDARLAGFDGAIIPDAPPEEEADLSRFCHQNHLARVYLVAPTSASSRAAFLAGKSEGFIYYVSLRGVTGARRQLPVDIQKNLKALKQVAKQPILIGFGVSSSEQSRMLGAMSQGVIVGSAIVEQLRHSNGKIAPAITFVQKMVQALKS